MRILVLRPQAEAERSARAIAARGHEPVIAPLFEVVRLPAAAPEGEYDALVLTSGNAVPVLEDAPSDWRKLPVFTVGARTAAKAREAGFVDARSADGDRNDLIELIQRNIASPARLLLVVARDRREDLPGRLTEAGYAVTIWTAYAAKALPDMPEAAAASLRGGEIGAILHYSARSAQTYLALAREAGLGESALTPTHVALSADVAAPLISAGADTVLVAEYPEEAAMLAALDHVSTRHNAPASAARAAVDADSGKDGMNTTSHDGGRAPAPQTRSGRTPPTLEGAAQELSAAESGARPDASIESMLPTEALPQEFDAPEPPAKPFAEPPTEPFQPRPNPPAPAASAPPSRSAIGWPALALAGLVGGVVGAGLMMLAASRATPAIDAAQLTELRDRIDALQVAATALDRKAAAASEAAAKAGAAATATASRLGELAKAQPAQAPEAEIIANLSAQAQRAEATASALGQRLEAATARLGSVETLAKTAAAPSAQGLAATRIVLAERVQSALASGKAFTSDVAALAQAGAAAEQVAPLSAVATSGAPTQSALLTGFREHRALFQRELTPADAGWQDRLLGLASRIVTIRPVGETGANDPATLLIRFENAITSANIVAAAGLWGQLPEPARRASADFGAALQKRAAADAAIAKIAQDAVAALGAAG